jgi:hypothetical protein
VVFYKLQAKFPFTGTLNDGSYVLCVKIDDRTLCRTSSVAPGLQVAFQSIATGDFLVADSAEENVLGLSSISHLQLWTGRKDWSGRLHPEGRQRTFILDR